MSGLRRASVRWMPALTVVAVLVSGAFADNPFALCPSDGCRESVCSAEVSKPYLAKHNINKDRCQYRAAVALLAGLDDDKSSVLMGAPGYYGYVLRPYNVTIPCPCCPGYFCPMALTCPLPCPRGASCPSPVGSAVPPDFANKDLQDNPYLQVVWNSTGQFAPMPCRARYYCKTTAHRATRCPEGYYCPIGTDKPKKCRILAVCPAGSDHPTLRLSGTIIFVIVVFTVILLLCCGNCYVKRQQRQREKKQILSRKLRPHRLTLKMWIRTIRSKGTFLADAAKRGHLSPLAGDQTEQLGNSPLDNCMSRVEAAVLLKLSFASWNSWAFNCRITRPTISLSDPARTTRTAVAQPEPLMSLESDSNPSQPLLDVEDRGRLMSTDTAVSVENMDQLGGMKNAFDQKRFRVDITFENLGLRLKNGKSVLDSVTGGFRSSRLTAIMGPSGAGKTTLLNTVMGKASYGRTIGKLFINGKEGSIKSIQRLVGFVPQDDVLHQQLTVKENIRFAGMMGLPPSVKRSQRIRIVRELIRILGLYDVRHSAIGDEDTRGVSGGQRKRCSIGTEMVQDPTLLFLDEPTSGLDSTSSQEVVQALVNVSRMGLTVVAVLHQPRYEIFTLFDDVCLLGKGGRTVYMGPSVKALDYFESIGFTCPPRMNPADFFMDVTAGQVQRAGGLPKDVETLANLWSDHSKANPGFQEDQPEARDTIRSIFGHRDVLGVRSILSKFSRVSPSVIKQPKRPWVCFQTSVVVLREFIILYRNLTTVILDVALLAFLGFLIGILFPKFNATMLIPIHLTICMVISLTAMVSSLRVFGNDRVIYRREVTDGFSRPAIFLGKNIVAFPALCLNPWAFLMFYQTFCVSFKATVPTYCVLVAIEWASSGIGYVISTVVSPRNSQMVCVIVATVMIIFGGAILSLKNMKEVGGPMLYYGSSLSVFRWSCSALLYLESTAAPESLGPIFDAMYQLGYPRSEDGFYAAVGILFAYGLVARLMAFLLLVVKK